MMVFERLTRWEGIIFGFMLGVAATVLGSMAYNEIHGLFRLSHWQRSLHDQDLEGLASLMEEELATAAAAMEDGVPLELSHYLAFQFMPKFYAHHMDFAATLLKNEDIDKFNSLRDTTPFLTFKLTRRDFSELDLTGVNFSGADLTGSDVSECSLTNANFWLAKMPRANLTGARVNDAVFIRCDLASAILTGINGSGADFEEAILVDASLTGLADLREANFAGAVMAQANLWNSKFPEARFDGADLTLVSAVDSDFAEVESMNDVILTGANLAGATLEAGRVERAWFVNADGLSSRTTRALRRHGGVAHPEEVVAMVDPRIVAGFRAQIEEDESIPSEDRESVLLTMLQQYYLN